MALCAQSTCFVAIRDNSADEFRLTVRHYQWMSIKDWLESCEVPRIALKDIISCCVLYNRPDFILILKEEISVGCGIGNQCMVLVKALKYNECYQELLPIHQAWSVGKPDVHPDPMVPLCQLLRCDVIASDTATIDNCFRRLRENGYDFVHTCNGNKPPLYHIVDVLFEKVILPCHISLLKIVFDLGADMNEIHHTRFPVFTELCHMALRNGSLALLECASEFSAAVKLFLYHNPSVKHNQHTIQAVIQYDAMIFDMYGQEMLSTFFDLCLAPTMHMIGFKLVPSDFQYAWPKFGPNYISDIADITDHVRDEFKETLHVLMEQPRRLEDMCRIVLRQTYTGRRIHNYIEKVSIPKPVKEFIVLESFGNL